MPHTHTQHTTHYITHYKCVRPLLYAQRMPGPGGSMPLQPLFCRVVCYKCRGCSWQCTCWLCDLTKEWRTNSNSIYHRRIDWRKWVKQNSDRKERRKKRMEEEVLYQHHCTRKGDLSVFQQPGPDLPSGSNSVPIYCTPLLLVRCPPSVRTGGENRYSVWWTECAACSGRIWVRCGSVRVTRHASHSRAGMPWPGKIALWECVVWMVLQRSCCWQIVLRGFVCRVL